MVRIAGKKRVATPKKGTAALVPPVADMVESIVGCKWSLSVLAAIRGGVHRPGELERRCDGISAKVLNERLRKMLRFRIVERRSFDEKPPRVEYHLTTFGRRFVRLIDDIDELQRSVDATGELRGRATRRP